MTQEPLVRFQHMVYGVRILNPLEIIGWSLTPVLLSFQSNLLHKYQITTDGYTDSMNYFLACLLFCNSEFRNKILCSPFFIHCTLSHLQTVASSQTHTRILPSFVMWVCLIAVRHLLWVNCVHLKNTKDILGNGRLIPSMADFSQGGFSAVGRSTSWLHCSRPYHVFTVAT